MNSDEEKLLFEENGWEYDFIKRRWMAPDGFSIHIEELIKSREFLGAEAIAEALENLAKYHGNQRT